ncbi:unnamed protein product [Pedinophyceae sp. YPF-701]|nr:unnamed protein product [Pedinophyceae sp. YPF-701]
MEPPNDEARASSPKTDVLSPKRDRYSRSFKLRASRTLGRIRNMGPHLEIFWSDLAPVQELGRGGFGAVMHMRHCPPGEQARDVAVKVLQADNATEKSLLAYIREVELLRAFVHPNVVQFEGVGLVEGADDEDPTLRDVAEGSASSEAAEGDAVLGASGSGHGLRPSPLAKSSATSLLHGARTSGDLSGTERIFLAQELCAGGSLRDLIKGLPAGSRKLPYRWDDGFRWLLGAARGLEYLHTSSPPVIHRDVKLDNILLGVRRGAEGGAAEESSVVVAKICDLGLARLLDERRLDGIKHFTDGARPREGSSEAERDEGAAEAVVGMPRDRFERSMSTMKRKRLAESMKLAYEEHRPADMTALTGSLMYMAPEVVRQEPYSERIDVFSFGMCIYEVLTMQLQIIRVLINRPANMSPAKSIEHYAWQVSQGYRPSVPQHWPQSIKDLLEACWQDNPRQRCTMTEVVEVRRVVAALATL